MSDKHTLVIKPRSGWVPVDFIELWQYRELATMLAWREILVRYKQSFLGIAWAILQPLATMVVFSTLFGILLGQGNLPTAGNLPYSISTYCALLPWLLFSQSVGRASGSLLNNQSLISKVYFPRLIIPLAPVLAALLDFSIALVVLFAMMVWYGVVPTMAIFSIPVFILLAVAFALGMSLLLASLSAEFRDIQHIVPFVIQILMYLSPVLYSANSVLKNQPELVRIIYYLNPMAGVIEGFRWALLGAPHPDYFMLGCSIISVFILLTAAAYYFKRSESRFSDVL